LRQRLSVPQSPSPALFRRPSTPPAFTRSRPYQNNANVPVEQNNWSYVRQLFGYDRFENAPLVDLMNDVYAHEWNPPHRHFCTPKLSNFDQTAFDRWHSILWAAMRGSE
jgi:hypothetical protein